MSNAPVLRRRVWIFDEELDGGKSVALVGNFLHIQRVNYFTHHAQSLAPPALGKIV